MIVVVIWVYCGLPWKVGCSKILQWGILGTQWQNPGLDPGCTHVCKNMFVVVIWVYCGLPWKVGMPKNFTMGNFGHPIAKSRLRSWLYTNFLQVFCDSAFFIVILRITTIPDDYFKGKRWAVNGTYQLNQSMTAAPKNSPTIERKSISVNFFEREIFPRKIPITPLQIFCELKFDSTVIYISIIGPDDTRLGDLQIWIG